MVCARGRILPLPGGGMGRNAAAGAGKDGQAGGGESAMGFRRAGMQEGGWRIRTKTGTGLKGFEPLADGLRVHRST